MAIFARRSLPHFCARLSLSLSRVLPSSKSEHHATNSSLPLIHHLQALGTGSLGSYLIIATDDVPPPLRVPSAAMDALPIELMLRWMERVGDQHRLVVASGVSRLWRSLATSDGLWLPFLQGTCPALAPLGLAPLGPPLELLRAWTRLQRSPTSPKSEEFSFVVELASVTHGVLLSKVLKGNASMSWCLSPGDFVLAPNVATWSSRSRVRPGDAAPELRWEDFYESGVRLLDILEANRFVLTVHAYHEGKGNTPRSTLHQVHVRARTRHLHPHIPHRKARAAH